jgi:hypothetical protein
VKYNFVTDKRIQIDGFVWHPQDILERLSSPELPGEEFWRCMAYALYVMKDDAEYVAALNDVKKIRTKFSFPQQEATTPQNELSVAPLRMMRPEGYTNNLPHKRKSSDKKISNAPKTLQYYVSGHKGMLREQQKRVDIIFKKFSEWGWIGSKTTSYDFNSLFTGEDRHCNIDWKKNTTVLSVLLSRMLNYKNRHEENLIVAQTGQSASSMVREQFNLTPNFDQYRLTEDDKFKIMLTLFILDVQNPLPLRYGGSDNDYDVSDAAFKEVLTGRLRITKGI